MKTIPNQNRVIRLQADVHRRAKILCASEGIPLSQFVGQALEKELRRRARRPQDDALAVALSSPPPVATR